MSDSDEDADPSPISSNQLHELHKDLTPENVRVRTNASEYMAQQLHTSAKTLIRLAEQKREEQEDNQLEREHVRQAIDEAFRPYNLMNDFLAMMEKYEYELQQEAASTQVLDFDELDDE